MRVNRNYRELAGRYDWEDPPNSWRIIWTPSTGDSPRRVHYVSNTGDFKIKIPPFESWEELQEMLFVAGLSMREILPALLMDYDDYEGENMARRFKKYICRGRLLSRIRAYRINGPSDTTFLPWHQMFAWRADGWECSFTDAEDYSEIMWTPIYKSPVASEDSSSSDDDKPGPSGQSGVQTQSSDPQRAEDADAGSSSQEQQIVSVRSIRTNTGAAENECLDSSSPDDDRPGTSWQSRGLNQPPQSRKRGRGRRRGTQTSPSTRKLFSKAGFSTGHLKFDLRPNAWVYIIDQKGDSKEMGHFPYYSSSSGFTSSSGSSSSESSTSESSTSESSTSESSSLDDQRPDEDEGHPRKRRRLDDSD